MNQIIYCLGAVTAAIIGATAIVGAGYVLTSRWPARNGDWHRYGYKMRRYVDGRWEMRSQTMAEYENTPKSLR